MKKLSLLEQIQKDKKIFEYDGTPFMGDPNVSVDESEDKYESDEFYSKIESELAKIENYLKMARDLAEKLTITAPNEIFFKNKVFELVFDLEDLIQENIPELRQALNDE